MHLDPDTEIASNFTIADYHVLRDALDTEQPAMAEWAHILVAFKSRIEERFLHPIRELERYDKAEFLPMRPGFAILALDCLLIDTIQSFREGRISTGEISPAASFKNFMRGSLAFKSFTGRDRDDFYGYVRSGLLHNGETRRNWKVRIDTPALLVRNQATKSRTINRRLFHAGILCEYRRLCREIKSGPADARKRFLRRMDAICGWPTQPLKHLYFAYGSNLLKSEIRKDADRAEPLGVAYLPGRRLVFDKHSRTRAGDAASLADDPSSMVWGYVYRLDDSDRKQLREREKGYREVPDLTVFLADGADGDPTPVSTFTFVGDKSCPDHCGPGPEYLSLVIEGAISRRLPTTYVDALQSKFRPK